jgi:Putative intracellular protease/amidase
MKKKIAVFLFNGFADWEISYLAPEINKSEEFDLVFFSKDGNPVLSMGGLQVSPDTSLAKISAEEADMLILPGGTAWEKGENKELNPLTKAFFEKAKPIAAICAATAYLGQLGLLNNLQHTSNDLQYLKAVAPQYRGESNYVNTMAVTGQHVITAKGVAPIEFAREIFEKLELFPKDYIEKWFQLFKNGIWSE